MRAVTRCQRTYVGMITDLFSLLLLPIYRAVKPEESDMVELFLREAVIMKDFNHRNVLRLIGVTFEPDGSPMVVLPYMANADLRQYIMNPSLVSTADSTHTYNI